MKVIKDVNELGFKYFGLNACQFLSGVFFAVLIGIFRVDNTDQIYAIFEIYLADRVELKSQMFYMSRYYESAFDRFFYKIGMNNGQRAGYAYDELLGLTGMAMIEETTWKGKLFSNVIEFQPMSPEEWERERALAHTGKAENNNEAN